MVENNYHAEKQKQCSQLGIQLITIFDIEWNETKKRRIIKSSIKAKLGLLSKRIAARKTVVQEVPGKEAKDFLVKNHLQSHSSATVNLGLYHNTELVSLLTMGRPRFDSKYEWEIIRFCSAVNTNVMGAFGKLMSFFHKQYHPNSIVTYANLRWGDGKLYENSGFTFVRRSSPSPWYCPSNKSMGKFYHRMRVQKYRLHEILKDFDPELTARENLKNHHFVAVYDCGTNVYKWEKPQNK
jgi:hypothetical protein